MSVKKSGNDPVEFIGSPTENADPPDMDHVAPLCTLMEFYESAEGGDEEENEIDLMIQLSGMTYDRKHTDD